MRRPEGTCASCWQPHPPSQERCFGPPDATERDDGETTTVRLASFLLDATNPRQDVAARAHGFQIDEAKRLAGWLRSATANDTLTADDFGLAPPSTPVERPQPDGLEELRKLSEAATAGPWAVEHRHCDATDEDDEMSGLGWEFVHNQGPPEPQLRGMFAKAADAHLIVQAVAYVRAVLATPPVPGDNP